MSYVYFLSFVDVKKGSMSLDDFCSAVSEKKFSSLAASSNALKSIKSYVNGLVSQDVSISDRPDISRYHLYRLRSMIYRVITAPICIVGDFDGKKISFDIAGSLSEVDPSFIDLEKYKGYHVTFSEIEKDLIDKFSNHVKSDSVDKE